MPPKVEYAREQDGRWIAEIPSLPGCVVYGDTKADAGRKVRALAKAIEAEFADLPIVEDDPLTPEEEAELGALIDAANLEPGESVVFVPSWAALRAALDD